MDLRTIDSKSPKIRIILAASSIALLLFAWISVRWQLGDMLATLTRESDPNIAEVAKLAISWAPGDPAARALEASAADTDQAVAALEEAVRLAPNDHRWRTQLGRALEQAEQIERAESELLRARLLAPSYSSVHWHVGNFYMRQERIESALSALKIAAENNPTYREQVFSLIWDYSDRDPGELERLAGDSPQLLARLAYFFAARGRSVESLEIWNRLGVDDKQKNVAVARAIALGLFDQKHFPVALDFAKQYGAEAETEPEAITNPSFERPLGDSLESRFGWRIERSDAKFDATPDSRVARSGQRSLRGTFKGYNKAAFSNVLQTMVVQSSRRYSLKVWLRTENLRSAGMPMIEIVNANDDSTLARSETITPGTNDWKQYTLEFAAPSNCNGITVRTIRAFCGEECPITGILWYDDFLLGPR